MRDRILRNEVGLEFYNTSPLRLATVSETHTREELNNTCATSARLLVRFMKAEKEAPT